MKDATVVLILATCFVAAGFGYTQTFTDVSQLLHPVSNAYLSWGSSAADFNNDGWVDIYVANGIEHRLYLNKGAEEFVDILPTSGIDDVGDPSQFIWGGIFGDYNRDGYLDLVVIGADKLYRNLRNWTFRDETSVGVLMFPDASQGSVWLDFDQDGRLDLFIGDDFGKNRLMRNVDNSSFSDISAMAGVTTVGGSYGAAASDFNNDGFTDVFIATCSASSPELSIKHLLRNNGNNTFTDVNVATGVNDSSASWGVVWLDYNNDGWFDLYVGNIPHVFDGENKLYRNNGDETFTDVATEAGVAGGNQEASFGVATADFDNDGWMDIYVANRNLAGEKVPHRLYHNNGDGTFTDIAASAGITADEEPTASVADFNNDGWIDIFVPGTPQSQLLFNDGGSNHWLKIRLRGNRSNLFGVGAKIEVFAGDLRQVKEINAGDGFVSQSHDLTAHFGLGAATEVDSIRVKWPGSGTDRISAISVDQEITVVEGIGLNNPPAAPTLLSPPDNTLLQKSQVRFTWLGVADPEQEQLSYRLHLSSPTTAMEFDDLRDTTYTVDLSSYETHEVFTWTVSVTDGHSIVAATELFTFDNGGIVGVSHTAELPVEFTLSQNYPNPFNPTTTICFSLPRATQVSLVVYNLAGREIRRLLDGFRNAGTHAVVWDGRDSSGHVASSGIYVSKLQARDLIATKKMILMK